MSFIARYLSGSESNTPHVEYTLQWVNLLFIKHGRFFKENSNQLLPAFRALQKTFLKIQEDLSKLYVVPYAVRPRLPCTGVPQIKQ